MSDRPWLDVEPVSLEGKPAPGWRFVVVEGECTVIQVFVGHVQVAAAVELSEESKKFFPHYRYHVVSLLPDNAVEDLPTVYAKDRARAEAWLQFLAELYLGRYTP